MGWIIALIAADGTFSAWGTWRTPETAEYLADKLRGSSPDFDISVQRVERWPGLVRARDELHA